MARRGYQSSLIVTGKIVIVAELPVLVVAQFIVALVPVLVKLKVTPTSADPVKV